MGPLAALGPLGGIADMALMAFGGPSFDKMNQQFGQELAQGIQSGKISPQYRVNIGQRAIGVRGAAGLLASEATTRPTFGAMRTSVGFLSGLGKVFGGIGTAISDVRGITSTIGAAIHPAATAAGKAATVALDAGTAGAKAVAAHPVLAASAAAAGMAAGAGAMSAISGTPAAKAHLTRVKKALGLHHRRMHVTNTRALHRALRRVKGFERVAKRVLSITHHRPTKVHFKFRKRRAA